MLKEYIQLYVNGKKTRDEICSFMALLSLPNTGVATQVQC
jgi:hypothetical protein